VSVKPPLAILNRDKETYSDAIKGKIDKNNKARTDGKMKIEPARRSALAITIWRRDGCGANGSGFMVWIREEEVQGPTEFELIGP